MFGFLNVYKPKGKTSHDVVAILRRVTKIKQIGHTGTLDPFAEGVLPICIGKATRLIEYLNDEKAYIGTVQLGCSTTTYDIEGEIVNRSDKKVILSEIEKMLEKFKGEIQQFPPIYSAIKVNGKKLYEYARNGEDVKIEPRKVVISRLDVLDFDAERQTIKLYIECSKGTYIRSIANDLGEELGTFGYLSKLERVKAGDFIVEESVKIENLDDIEKVEKALLSPEDYLNYRKYELKEDEKERISHGNDIKIDLSDGVVVLMNENKVIAVGDVKNSVFKCKKVFV